MQYEVFAANYPLNEETGGQQLPGTCAAPWRRPGSRYSCCAETLQPALSSIRCRDTTECSIEEIASRVIDRMGIDAGCVRDHSVCRASRRNPVI
jgi:hypothetical protein